MPLLNLLLLSTFGDHLAAADAVTCPFCPLCKQPALAAEAAEATSLS